MNAESDNGRMLLINKPLEWTSFDVVNKLRGKLKIKKIGHAGTLDPLATGLLIICVGRMTKQIDQFMGMEK
jgi:tRNA pseudouridine55 synthase